MKRKTKRNRNKTRAVRSVAMVMAAGLMFGVPATAVLSPSFSIEVEAADTAVHVSELSEWKYSGDRSTRAYVLEEYIGSYTNVQIPTSFDGRPVRFNDFTGLNTGKITHLSFADGFKFQPDMSTVFAGNYKLKSIDLSNVDTSEVTTMGNMFAGCSSLTSLDLSNFDTSNVTDMRLMFSHCVNLTSLDLSNFDTSKVTNMNGMFQSCVRLKSLDVSNFKTSNVTDMGCLFDECESLTDIDVSGFDTSNVWNMNAVFACCYKLASLDVTNFNTSNVTDMSVMFAECYELTNIDVSSFDTSKVTDMNQMFANCDKLEELDLSNFDVSNVKSFERMTNGSNSLARIYTPKTKVSSTSALPDTFYLVGDDRMAHADSDSYTDLSDAPVSSLIVTILDTKIDTSTEDDKTTGDDTTTSDNTSASGGNITFNKYFVLDSEASVPTETFSYTIEAGKAQAYSIDNQAFEVLAGVGAPKIGTANFTPSDKTSTAATDGVTLADGQAYAVSAVSVDFTGIAFDEPGVYRYVITETNDGAQGVTYDSADTRYLDVYVTTDDAGVLSVESYVLHTSDSTVSMNETSGTAGGKLADKSYGYVNSYTSHNLTIASKVKGNQASKDKYFKINVELSNAAPNSTLPIELSGDHASADAMTESNAATLEAYRGVANPTSITIGSDGTGNATLYLSADQSVRIDGLTEGTAYTVTTDPEDYTPSVSASGDTSVSKDSDAATVKDTSLTADTTVTVTATRQGTVPTGVILPILPYVIAAGVAGTGIALTAKKKNHAE